ncbi:MAG: ABC transporter substrate-binding protein [Proteobacteria bacterium]|nr:ABC transporter substrate-binding protein [Pseudomonadota bacterium]
MWLIRILILLALVLNSGYLSAVCPAAEPIKIAAVFAKTGIAAIANREQFKGVALAAEEINRQGGILGRRLEVIELDNKSTSLESKLAAIQAIRLGVTAVIGASWSSHSLAMAPVLQKAGIPMISSDSTNPEVTLVGDYIFRVCFIDSFQGEAMATFAHKDLGAVTAVVLTNVSSQYCIGLSSFFIRSFTAVQGKVLWQGKYKEKTADFSRLLNRVKALKPDVVFVPGNITGSSLILKQAARIGVRAVFLGGDAWTEKMYTYAGSAPDGNYFCTMWDTASPFPRSRRLLKAYRKKYGRGIVICAVPLAYDAVMVLADAIERAGSLRRDAIRKALAATKGFSGATGTISFDSRRNPINKPAVIMKFQRGKAVYVKTVSP